MNINRENLAAATRGGRSYLVAPANLLRATRPELQSLGDTHRDKMIFCRACDGGRPGAGATRALNGDVYCATCSRTVK